MKKPDWFDVVFWLFIGAAALYVVNTIKIPI